MKPATNSILRFEFAEDDYGEIYCLFCGKGVLSAEHKCEHLVFCHTDLSGYDYVCPSTLEALGFSPTTDVSDTEMAYQTPEDFAAQSGAAQGLLITVRSGGGASGPVSCTSTAYISPDRRVELE